MDEMNRETHRQEDTTEIDLVQLALDFFRIAKKRWWLFAGLLAVGTAIAFGVSFIQYTPLYRCEATFTVSTGGKHRVLLLHHSGGPDVPDVSLHFGQQLFPQRPLRYIGNRHAKRGDFRRNH